MRLMTIAVLLVVAQCGFAVGVDPSTPSKLLGEWEVVAAQQLGEKTPLDQVSIRFEFSPTQLALRFSELPSLAGEAPPTQVYDCTWGRAGELQILDIIVAKGDPGRKVNHRFLAIYQLDGDELVMCYREGGKDGDSTERPVRFESSRASSTHLFRLNRLDVK